MLRFKPVTFQAIITSFLIFLSGCATVVPLKTIPPPVGMPGIYHRVEKGQTLWRISKTYNSELDELARINRISDASSIEIGQMIFIPHRQKPMPLVSKYSSDDFIWPLRGRIITSFGQTYGNIINKGINIEPRGNDAILAARAGKVVFYSDSFGGFGKTIIIEHPDGFSTVYARNAEVFVKAGDNIQKGTEIASAGSAGRDKNTYLHFEIRKGHIPQNPVFYLPR
ncbi:MAG: LysM peptidoglycan-binding domain-containing M23 family metallopeptidase [Candidatus Omnitrophota bacterium]